MAEHSPLPFVEDVGRIRDANGVSVALCSPDVNGHSASMSKANAAFIVAAVNSHQDLVDALRDMTDMFERHLEGDEGPSDAADRWDRARAALAKATGGDDVE